MPDWRRHGRADRIWQGALVTSCLIHFCVVACGWILISQPDNLLDLRNTIRVSLIKPQSKPLPTAPVTQKTVPRPISRPQAVEPAKQMASPPQPKPQPIANKTLLPEPQKPPPAIVRKAKPLKKTALAPTPKIQLKPKPLDSLPTKIPAPPTTAVTTNEPTPPEAATANKHSPQPLTKLAASPLPTTALSVPDAAEHQEAATVEVRENYLNLLRERIDRFKRYPLMARKGRQQGVVLIEFELSTAGDLKSCQVKESCGYRLLDRAALQAVATAAPFPEVPPQIGLNESNFIVPVRFVLSR